LGDGDGDGRSDHAVSGLTRLGAVFPALPRSASQVRTFVSGAVARLAPAVDLDDAVLAADELAANAIRHARTRFFRVDVALRLGALWVGVTDDDPTPPALASADLAAGGGRGLPLVAALSDRWGIATGRGGGKCVWYEMRAA
jgi:anti-sigma regulatory factor (Ser/Thr protein kinase)